MVLMEQDEKWVRRKERREKERLPARKGGDRKSHHRGEVMSRLGGREGEVGEEKEKREERSWASLEKNEGKKWMRKGKRGRRDH